MKKKTKKIIRFTSITEYKTLERLFEKQASEGWMLYEIKRELFKFKKVEPVELKFNVSLFYHTNPFDYPDDEKQIDYRILCEQSGWKFCTSNQIYQIFYINAEEIATPIHTDSREEYNIIKSVLFKTELIGLISLLLMGSFGLFNFFNYSYEFLLSNGMFISMLSPFFMYGITIIMFAPSIIWLVKNRENSKKGLPLSFVSNKKRVAHKVLIWTSLSIYLGLMIFSLIDSFASRGVIIGIASLLPLGLGLLVGKISIKRIKTKKNTRKRNIIFVSIAILLTWVISVTALMSVIITTIDRDYDNNIANYDDVLVLELSDFGNIEKPSRTRSYDRTSYFVPVNFEYYESLRGKPKEAEVTVIRTTYMKCRSNKIAEYIFEQYLKEEHERNQKRLFEEQEYLSEEQKDWYKNAISSIDKELWNIDNGYYLNTSMSEIILLKNDMIYILDGDIDFSNNDIIDKVGEKLKL